MKLKNIKKFNVIVVHTCVYTRVSQNPRLFIYTFLFLLR